jgi:stage II sporulation protein D
MKWSRGALILLATVATACAPGSPVAFPSAPFRAPAAVRVQVAGGSVRQVPLEDYVQAVTLSEFAPASGDAGAIGRMLEIQAIISRTYAVAHIGRHRAQGFDLCATTHCQLFEPARLRSSRWAPAAADAVRRTASIVLWYGAAPASALFHADCGGRISDAADVWGGNPRPYLREAADDGPAAAAHGTWTYEATRDAVRDALNATAATRVGNRLDRIEVLERDAAGRAARLSLAGQQERIVRGEDFRAALTRVFGPRTIKSTRFEVRRNGGSFVFDGRGFGHGAGLCQAGALARIRAGASPAAVVARYYPGTTLVRLK